ncbi:MAG: caspase domain-containing protein [Bacteroidia bacterium]
MATRNLYALLVGIDEYPIDSHRLFGCHNDVAGVKSYLDNRVNRNDFNLNVKTLLSKDATRLNIVRGFDEYLSQAGEDDVAFFFYSGHGSQEPSGSFFDHLEQDDKNETLVCWDSRIEDGMDLADKEIATLIARVAEKNPHIITILDCCNSGSATRKVEDGNSDFLVRQTPSYKNDRPLDSYILPRNSGSRGALATGENQRLHIPTGRHIALTAAESFQLAKETTLGGSRRGVFSYSLLELLQNASYDMSYEDLMRRVQGLVTRRTFDQNPTFFVANSADADLGFLGGAAGNTSDYFLMSFDRQKGWQLDAGSVHGIVKVNDRETTILAVFPEDATQEDDLNDLDKALGEVQVTELTAAGSIVEPLGSWVPDREKSYRCRVVTLPVEMNKIFLFGDEGGLAPVRARLGEGGEESAYLQEVKSVGEADYKLIALNNEYVISRAADGTGDAQFKERHGIDFRPLVEQVPTYSAQSAEKVLDQLIHITRWERSLDLRNPQSGIAGQVKVELLEPERDELIKPEEGGYRFRYASAPLSDPSSSGAETPSFRVRLRNTGSKPYFCSLIYYSSDFAADPNTLEEGGLWIGPGETAWVAGGAAIEASVADNYYNLGRNRLEETFKLIASTQKFAPGLLELPALGQPKVESMRSIGAEESAALDDVVTRGGLKIRRKASGKLGDWTSDELTIVIERN